ncbi:MAG: hypothetical protein IJF27_01865 [Oscillospiraceae bacterium]|nr:hypothetical protein [Oscillospiraceae bacterium]MBQ3049792.1 hypothetical protein [Oscillospiraceae bacterium]
MNQYQTPQNGFYPPPQQPKNNGVALASLICGIVAFILNPLYLISVAAIITGIIGIANANGAPKGKAVAGIILAVIATAFQFTLDLILSVFTFGLSFFF